MPNCIKTKKLKFKVKTKLLTHFSKFAQFVFTEVC